MILGHIIFIAISNISVKYPFELFGYHTTWGALSYPFIFILTDLTARILSPHIARKVILFSMLPSLLISYLISSYIEFPNSMNWTFLVSIHPIPLRISLACLIAYITGQLMDIYIFQHLRKFNSWWIAPTVSTLFGNIIDTLLFFTLAFYHSSNAFLNEHWMEIAIVDVGFKIVISFVTFIPLYGVILQVFNNRITSSSTLSY